MILIHLKETKSMGWCTETNKFISRGEKVLWDPDTKRLYSQFSPTYQAWEDNMKKTINI
jgi:hypothetical protein